MPPKFNSKDIKIVAAIRGMHVRNIASESVTEKCDGRTDRQTDKQTTDKVIPMCRYASQATQKWSIGLKVVQNDMVQNNLSKILTLVVK